MRGEELVFVKRKYAFRIAVNDTEVYGERLDDESANANVTQELLYAL